MTFIEDNAAYETWLGNHCKIVPEGIVEKHKRMAKDEFTFLRATYFRWAKRIQETGSEVADAPKALSVGDAHMENFGTWRDGEGRLIWGINDFDDAAMMPYTFDLVRLTASARLAPLDMKGKEAAAVILAGYKKGLKNPRPTLLDEQETWMRPFIVPSTSARRKFWPELRKLDDAAPDEDVKSGFARSFPKGIGEVQYKTRIKGGGGLGRPRYVAIASWRGGHAVREAKALVPSAWNFVHKIPVAETHFLELAEGRFRSPDPFLHMHSGFIYRRISADARKLDLEDELVPQIEPLLLEAMGFDLASIHAADEETRKRIAADLDERKDGWLHDAAKIAADDVKGDFGVWQKHWEKLAKQAKPKPDA